MNDFMMQIAIQVLAPMAVTVGSAVAIWILGEVGRWVRTKTKNEQVGAAVNQLCYTAAATVAELEQVLVPAIKARSEDGKLTQYDKRRLRMLALDRIKKRLAPDVRKQAGKAITDIDGFLRAQIEQAVLEMKAVQNVK